MNEQSQSTQQQASNVQGFIADVKVYLNEERGTLTHRLPDNMRIEMPIHRYKKLLGLPIEETELPNERQMRQTNSMGFIAQPAIYFSRDGQYLIHRVLGIRVAKHINYYKQIFGAEYARKTQTA